LSVSGFSDYKHKHRPPSRLNPERIRCTPASALFKYCAEQGVPHPALEQAPFRFLPRPVLRTAPRGHRLARWRRTMPASDRGPRHPASLRATLSSKARERPATKAMSRFMASTRRGSPRRSPVANTSPRWRLPERRARQARYAQHCRAKPQPFCGLSGKPARRSQSGALIHGRHRYR